jgi:hypothetical protein
MTQAPLDIAPMPSDPPPAMLPWQTQLRSGDVRAGMWLGGAMIAAGAFVTAAGYAGLSAGWIALGVAVVAMSAAIGVVTVRRPA